MASEAERRKRALENVFIPEDVKSLTDAELEKKREANPSNSRVLGEVLRRRKKRQEQLLNGGD